MFHIMAGPGRPRKNAASTKSNNVAESIGKQQFQVLDATAKLLEKLSKTPDLVSEIKAEVEEIQQSFAYDVQEKEVETNEKKKALDEELKVYKTSIESQKETLDEQLDEHKKEFDRELEKLKYDHSLTKRDEDVSTAEYVASKHSMSLVDTAEWTEKKALSEFNDEREKVIREEVAAEVEKKVNSAKNAEIRNLKHSSEMEVAMAKKDIESLTREVDALRKENISLKATIDQQNSNIVSIAESATRPTTVEMSKK